jgi:hypothetical protein
MSYTLQPEEKMMVKQVKLDEEIRAKTTPL